MGQALYRKYRSKSLDDIVGQDHITQNLKQAINSGRISHAYLLTGPRGVGKTSVARILAHEINQLPYEDDSSHIDIIEIDAASNRRIDEIRELREKVYIAPTSAEYKVYIIDEVHMLTKEAFNALLKTLEEPPAHVVFILATTDAHKLPETIISRTQRYTFKPVDIKDITKQLKFIAKTEGLKIDDDALQILAEHGEGSFRDAISLLDQASNINSNVSSSDVLRLLGIPTQEAVLKIISNVYNKSTMSKIMSDLNTLYSQGFQAAMIAKQMGAIIRNDILSTRPKFDQEISISLLTKLIQTPEAYNPDRYLEISLLEYAGVSTNIGQLSATTEKNISEEPIESRSTPEAILEVTQISVLSETVKSNNTKESSVNLSNFKSEVWPELLAQLKKGHNTLYGVVRMAQADIVNGHLVLAFAFPFHQKRINDSKNSQVIAELFKQITNSNIIVECIVDKAVKIQKMEIRSNVVSQKTSNLEIKIISNIFGGAELLES